MQFSVQDIIDRVRSRLFQPDPNNSNFSDTELLRWINDVKDDIFSRVGADAVKKVIIADGESEEFNLNEDVRVIEAVSVDNQRFPFLDLEEQFDAGPIPFIQSGRVIRPSDGVFYRDGILSVRPTVEAGKEIVVHFRRIPKDFLRVEEIISIPGRGRRAFVFGTCAEARMKLAGDANVASTSDWLSRYEREIKLIQSEFKNADQPREPYIKEVL